MRLGLYSLRLLEYIPWQKEFPIMRTTKQAPEKQDQKHQQHHSQKDQQQKTRQAPAQKKQGPNAGAYQEHEHAETRMTD